MAISSRNKGKRGELELAHYLTERGFPAARGVQYRGGPNSPDVTCDELKHWHIECKRVERMDMEAWMAQALRDCGEKVPIVMHRKNDGQWLATLRLDDFLNFMNGML